MIGEALTSYINLTNSTPIGLNLLDLYINRTVYCRWEVCTGVGQARKSTCVSGWLGLIDPHGLAAGPQDRGSNKAAGLATKLTVLWQWTGRYFEHWDS